jgi:hypothetical protein
MRTGIHMWARLSLRSGRDRVSTARAYCRCMTTPMDTGALHGLKSFFVGCLLVSNGLLKVRTFFSYLEKYQDRTLRCCGSLRPRSYGGSVSVDISLAVD